MPRPWRTEAALAADLVAWLRARRGTEVFEEVPFGARSADIVTRRGNRSIDIYECKAAYCQTVIDQLVRWEGHGNARWAAVGFRPGPSSVDKLERLGFGLLVVTPTAITQVLTARRQRVPFQGHPFLRTPLLLDFLHREHQNVRAGTPAGVIQTNPGRTPTFRRSNWAMRWFGRTSCPSLRGARLEFGFIDAAERFRRNDDDCLVEQMDRCRSELEKLSPRRMRLLQLHLISMCRHLHILLQDKPEKLRRCIQVFRLPDEWQLMPDDQRLYRRVQSG